MKPYLCWCLGLSGLFGLIWAGESLWVNYQRTRLISQEYEPPPDGMVLVAAGWFTMGSNDPDAEPDETPQREVFVPAFYLDKFEVTNRRYKQLIPGHRYPANEDDLPVTHVFKHDAEEFCRRADRRLPTNAEWEKAAHGDDGRRFPWGNHFDANLANINRRPSDTNKLSCRLPNSIPASKGKLPGGSFPKSASPHGCHDMAGNVWEWVGDVWQDKNAFGLTGHGEVRGIIRGGAYSYSSRQARTTYQGFEALDATCHDVGFRCAMDAVPKSK